MDDLLTAPRDGTAVLITTNGEEWFMAAWSSMDGRWVASIPQIKVVKDGRSHPTFVTFLFRCAELRGWRKVAVFNDTINPESTDRCL